MTGGRVTMGCSVVSWLVAAGWLAAGCRLVGWLAGFLPKGVHTKMLISWQARVLDEVQISWRGEVGGGAAPPSSTPDPNKTSVGCKDLKKTCSADSLNRLVALLLAWLNLVGSCSSSLLWVVAIAVVVVVVAVGSRCCCCGSIRTRTRTGLPRGGPRLYKLLSIRLGQGLQFWEDPFASNHSSFLSITEPSCLILLFLAFPTPKIYQCVFPTHFKCNAVCLQMPASDLKRFFADVLSILSTTMQKEGQQPQID